MAPYSPPVAHYNHYDCSELTNCQIRYAIGNKGINLYNLTNKYNLEYVWWNKEKKLIEFWGKEYAVESAPKKFARFLIINEKKRQEKFVKPMSE